MVSKVFVRSAFNYDVEVASDEAAVGGFGVSLTVQAHAEDADLNVLMRRYGVTGKMPENVRLPEYGDFEGISDFATALSQVSRAAEEFMRIPADIRAKFDNDPQKFLVFVVDPVNDEYLRKVGLKRPFTEDELKAKELARRASPEYRLAELERAEAARVAAAGGGSSA